MDLNHFLHNVITSPLNQKNYQMEEIKKQNKKNTKEDVAFIYFEEVHSKYHIKRRKQQMFVTIGRNGWIFCLIFNAIHGLSYILIQNIYHLLIMYKRNLENHWIKIAFIYS